MGVEFEEDNLSRKYQSHSIIGEPVTPSFSSFFIKTGIVKNENQAYIFLIFLIILCVVAAIAIYYVFVVNAGHPPLPASAIYDNY